MVKESPIPTTVYDTLSRWLRPRIVLASIGAGLAMTTILAKRAEKVNYLSNDFRRITEVLSPENVFYPPLPMLVNHVRGTLKADQIAVIVGGSSVMNGVSQGPDDLWSLKLGERLGSGFRVYNFSYHGASFQDTAMQVAEILLKEGQKVVYVGDLQLGFIHAPGLHSHNAYWEAYYKGALFDKPTRHEMVKGMPFSAYGADLRDARLGTLASLVTSSISYWHYIAYNYFFTVLTRDTFHRGKTFMARKDFADDFQNLTPVSVPERFERWSVDQTTGLIKGFAQRVCPDFLNVDKNLLAEHYQSNLTAVKQSLPDPVKRAMFMILLLDAHYYRKQLPAKTQVCYEAVVANMEGLLNESGVTAASFGKNWDDADHSDRVHIGPSGALKLADEVAPYVRKIARDLYAR